MHQPEALKSPEYQLWSRGRGVEVWAMLEACPKGDHPTVERRLAQDPHLPECERHYCRPLQFAVRKHHQLRGEAT